MNSGTKQNCKGTSVLCRFFAAAILCFCLAGYSQEVQISDVVKAEQAVEEAKSVLRSAKGQLEDVAKAQKKSLKAVGKAEASIAKAEKKLADVSVKVDRQAQKLEAAEDEADKAKLQAKLDELKAEAASKSAELDEARKTLASMKENAKAVDADYDKAFKNVQDAQAKLDTAKIAVDTAEENLKARKAAEKAAEVAAEEKAKAEKKAAAEKAKAEKKAAAEKAKAEKAARKAAEVAAEEKAKAEKKAAAEKVKAEKKAAAEKAKAEKAARKAAEKAEKEAAAVAEAEKPVKSAKTAEVAPTAAATVAAPAPAAEEATVEENVFVAPWSPASDDKMAEMKGGKKINAPEEKVEAQQDDSAVCPQFVVAMVSGDKKVVEELKLWEDWSSYIVFNKVTVKQVRDFHAKLLKAVQEKGYIFAQIVFPTRTWNNGIFVAVVDLGKVGDITVKNSRHYSPRQIVRALENREGRFNYADVHSGLFDLNARPDLKINTQLQTEKVDGRRIINAELDVKDKLPIHGAIELSNTGSKDSDSDWRIRATLQHLNLTKRGDSLTLDYLTGGDVADNLNAVSGSYFLPINDRNRINVYAGWSSSSADDVLPELNVRGRGWFAGAAFTHTLWENELHNVEVSLGWFYQRYEQFQDLNGMRYDDNDTHTVSMPSITLGYSSKMFDAWGGRNFASISVKQNRAGQFGASSSRQFNETSAGKTDGDFKVWSIQIARFQRLFSGEDRPGKWSLFAKANAQIASDGLPTVVRDYVGGMNSVRGYRESELGGDNSFVGSIELRTPLMENFIPGMKQTAEEFKKNPDVWSQHRLQLITFTDIGYVSERNKQGASDDQGFWSVGAGLRLGLTKFAQMSLDYGFPIIEASDETPNDGRLHLSLQVQF